MPRQCTVCKHTARQAIDTAIVSMVSFRAIANRYGISKASVQRHASSHLPEALNKAATRRGVEAEEILQSIVGRRDSLAELYEECKEKKESMGAVSAAKVLLAHDQILLQASGGLTQKVEVHGELDSRQLVVIQDIISAVRAEAPQSLQVVLDKLGISAPGDGNGKKLEAPEETEHDSL